VAHTCASYAFRLNALVEVICSKVPEKSIGG
jgi:hypothetical protein